MDRKEAMRQYRETHRPAGVFRVTHLPSGRVLLGANVNVAAMLNRVQAQLSLGSHPNRQLQSDWDADGATAFTFEVLDTLPPPETPNEDASAGLETLLELWKDTLGPDLGASY